MTERRIFVAFPISEKVKDVRDRIVRHFPDAPVRWVPPNDLHITAVAPWISKDVQEDKKMLARIAEHARSFTIRFGLVEPGPTIIAPRLVWIKGKIDGPYAASLQKQMTMMFDRAHDFKKWLPHVTIGRFRQDVPGVSPVHTVYERVDIHETISEIVLMESQRLSEGASYSTLARMSLRG